MEHNHTVVETLLCTLSPAFCSKVRLKYKPVEGAGGEGGGGGGGGGVLPIVGYRGRLCPKRCSFTGIHINFFLKTRQLGKDVRKDTCPDLILLAHSKLCNNQNTVKN